MFSKLKNQRTSRSSNERQGGVLRPVVAMPSFTRTLAHLCDPATAALEGGSDRPPTAAELLLLLELLLEPAQGPREHLDASDPHDLQDGKRPRELIDRGAEQLVSALTDPLQSLASHEGLPAIERPP